jgi:hypothetical protein
MLEKKRNESFLFNLILMTKEKLSDILRLIVMIKKKYLK